MSAKQISTAPDLEHLGLLAHVTFDPIFIMGDHRTGTTLLYNLLNSTEYFNVVTAYHIIRYNELLSHYLNKAQDQAKQQLSTYFEQLGVIDRIIDGVAVTPDLPEEYGFLLSTEYKAPLTSQNLPKFTELCKKIQLISDTDRPLLLKNPWDYFLNFMFVKHTFPQARFIFIHRHPIDVISSQLRAIRSSMRSRSAYLALISEWYARLFRRPVQRLVTRLMFSSLFELGARIATRHVARASSYFVEHIGLLPESDYISVTYEALCKDPAVSVGSILTFLGLEQRQQVCYSDFVAPRSLPPLPEVRRRAGDVCTQLQPYLRFCGYDV